MYQKNYEKENQEEDGVHLSSTGRELRGLMGDPWNNTRMLQREQGHKL